MHYPAAHATSGWVCSTVLLVALAGCGGGGSSSGTASAPAPAPAPASPPAPTTQSITTVAPISGFGSIFVGGVEFETDSASFELEDRGASESELALGMRVRVEGTVNDDGVTGNAQRVLYEAELVGPVSSAPLIEDDGEVLRFNVFDTQVVAERTVTSFDDSSTDAFSFDTLAQGDVVEVSGALNGLTGVLEATRIERRPAGTATTIIKGSVAGLATDASSFTLAGVTVNVDGNTDLSRLAGGLTDGAVVRVRGTLQSDGSVLASVIRPDKGELADAPDNDEAELEGLIEMSDDLANLLISGQQVDASSATVTPSGSDLAVGQQVKVKGTLNGDVLVATTVSIRSQRVRASAAIAAVDATANTFSLRFGGGDQTLEFAVDTASDIRDSGTDLSIADLRIDETVRVRAARVDNVLTAEHVRRKDDNGTRLQGAATSLDEMAGLVEIEGVSFATDANTVFQREQQGEDDLDISAAEFFASASVGSLVKAKDRDDDGTAEEIELELRAAELRRSRTVQGQLTAIADDDASLELAGERFELTDSTEFTRRGATLTRAEFDALAAAGTLLVVTDSDGDGSAERVRIGISDDGTQSELKALLEAFDATAGTLTLSGQEFGSDADTAFFVDVSGSADAAVTAAEFFARLTVNQSVVKARDLDGDGILETAVLTSSEDDESELELEVQGPVQDFDAIAGTITIAGQTFSTDAGTRFKRDVRGDDDVSLTRDAFFAALSAGVIVEVKDDGNDGVADKLKLK